MTYQVMTKSRWLQTVADNSDSLRQMVSDYHPSARQPAAFKHEAVLLTDGEVVEVDATSMPITAPNAELACREVRQLIRKEEPVDPVKRWDRALSDGDIATLSSLLSGAWFGVPESTGCWNIPGFDIACDLMDDPPEED